MQIKKQISIFFHKKKLVYFLHLLQLYLSHVFIATKDKPRALNQKKNVLNKFIINNPTPSTAGVPTHLLYIIRIPELLTNTKANKITKQKQNLIHKADGVND